MIGRRVDGGGVPASGARTLRLVLGLLLTATATVVAAGAPAVAATSTPTGFAALTPTQIVDTRIGLGAPKAALGAGASLSVQVAGVAGVPASGVTAVSLQVTGIRPTAATRLVVYPAGSTPTLTTLNVPAGATVANLVVGAVGSGGKVAIFNAAGSINLTFAVSGWFSGSGQLQPVAPARVLDTRTGVGVPAAALGPAQTLTVQVTGRGGVPSTGVVAVVMNLTGTSATTATGLTSFATGTTRPAVRSISVSAGQTVSAQAIVPVGATGKLSVFNAAGTVQVIGDVFGWLSAAGQFVPTAAGRLVDTRAGTALGPGGTLTASPTGSIASQAVLLAVTAVNPTASGFLSAVPSGTSVTPATAAVNFVAGRTTTTTMVVPVPQGSFTVYNSAGTTNVLVDQLGVFDLPVTIGTAAVPQGFVTSGYSFHVSASGGVGPYTWALAAGALPAGLAVTSGGVISGTPTAAGTTSFTVQVTDSRGVRVVRDFTLTVRSFAPAAAWAWGFNTQHSLGNGTASTGIGDRPDRPTGLSGITAVAGGGFTGYALASDGTIWSWGASGSGQLGVPFPAGPSDFGAVPVHLALSSVTAIAASQSNGYALRADGTVWAWGATGGNGIPLQQNAPVQVPNLGTVTAIAASSSGRTAYALRADGTVWAWGSGQSGALGNGTTTASIAPVQVSGLTAVVAIGAGALRGFAVTSDGALWAWGNGAAGGLGTGITANSTVPVRVAGLTAVTAVAGGGASYALTRDGTVWAWGSNNVGQAGNGTTTNTLTPTRVVGLPVGITQIAAGATNGYALDGSGTLWSWGDMSLGQGATDPTLRSFITTAAAVNLLPALAAIGSESATGLGVGLP